MQSRSRNFFPVFHRFPHTLLGTQRSHAFSRIFVRVRERVKIIFILSVSERDPVRKRNRNLGRWASARGWWDADGDAHVRGREGERHKPFRTVHIAARCHRGNTFCARQLRTRPAERVPKKREEVKEDLPPSDQLLSATPKAPLQPSEAGPCSVTPV